MPPTSFLAAAGALLLLCTAARAASSPDCAFEWEPLRSADEFEFLFPSPKDRCDLLRGCSGGGGGGAPPPLCNDDAARLGCSSAANETGGGDGDGGAPASTALDAADWRAGRSAWGNGWGGWGRVFSLSLSRSYAYLVVEEHLRFSVGIFI